jgi:hypothetical protein
MTAFRNPSRLLRAVLITRALDRQPISAQSIQSDEVPADTSWPG